ncbi:MAG: zinc ribbon domain-containing protein [Muribaculaceae bacterium]|nr:zinc ribbon domain-containing protein [Muribaculaceae bacterium]
MFSKELEEIIDAALADGVLTDTERRVLHKRAAAEGVDPDELDVVVEGRLAKMKRESDWLRPAPPKIPTQVKYGNVLTCPSCGAQVKAGAARCEECGYAFTNISATNSARELQRKIEEFDRRNTERLGNQSSGLMDMFNGMNALNKQRQDQQAAKSKLNMISTFPVPNSRADLLDLMSMVEVQMDVAGPHDGINMTQQENMSYGYWLLFSNCINKARISFANDPDFAHFFARYDEEVQKTKGLMGWWRTRGKLAKFGCGYVIVVIALFLLLGILAAIAG